MLIDFNACLSVFYASCMYVNVFYTYLCVHMRVYPYLHIYIYIYIYAHIHLAFLRRCLALLSRIAWGGGWALLSRTGLYRGVVGLPHL